MKVSYSRITYERILAQYSHDGWLLNYKTILTFFGFAITNNVLESNDFFNVFGLRTEENKINYFFLV